MEQIINAFAHISIHGAYWRVRLTADGVKRPVWRLLLRADFPAPEAAIARVARHLPQPVRLSWTGWLL